VGAVSATKPDFYCLSSRQTLRIPYPRPFFPRKDRNLLLFPVAPLPFLLYQVPTSMVDLHPLSADLLGSNLQAPPPPRHSPPFLVFCTSRLEVKFTDHSNPPFPQAPEKGLAMPRVPLDRPLLMEVRSIIPPTAIESRSRSTRTFLLA